MKEQAEEAASPEDRIAVQSYLRELASDTYAQASVFAEQATALKKTLRNRFKMGIGVVLALIGVGVFLNSWWAGVPIFSLLAYLNYWVTHTKKEVASLRDNSTRHFTLNQSAKAVLIAPLDLYDNRRALESKIRDFRCTYLGMATPTDFSRFEATKEIATAIEEASESNLKHRIDLLAQANTEEVDVEVEEDEFVPKRFGARS